MNNNTNLPSLQPAIFIGHGSPILIIEENTFTPKWRELALSFPKPKAILCISAHWVERDLRLTASEHPPLIYDFRGFPKELYEISYPAPGSPALAEKVQALLGKERATLDYQRGWDHGAWAVCRMMYPEADIPIVQLSLSSQLSLEEHMHVAKELKVLRQEGILILASGNLVHNLREIDWPRSTEVGYGYDWAKKAQEELLGWIEDEDYERLLHYYKQGQEINLAIPTAEHFIPLLYILEQKNAKDKMLIFNEDFVGGSLDMTSIAFMPQ